MRLRSFGVGLFLLLAACAAGTGDRASSQRGDGQGDGDGDGDSSVEESNDGDFQNPTPIDEPIGPPMPGCGDGVRSRSEACDDGNTMDGDGCRQDCRGIELGFACQEAGMPCRPIALCGDGVVAPSEGCDDRNATAGDGCSERCKIELGWKCETPASPCTPTTCGDGVHEGAESCDDGNTVPFDGCSAHCRTEPDCAAGACSSSCGDGLVIDEACDDGNTRDGDGCSATCEVEAGFMCGRADDCERVGEACVLRVPALYRDFGEAHPDFGVGCGTMITGVVEERLGAEHKPVLRDGSAVCIESQASFSEWYRAANALTPGELVLFDNGAGGFVNRFGDGGEQFEGRAMYQNLTYGGPAGGGCGMCTPTGAGQCFDPCTPWNDMNQACCGELQQMLYDGNPLFFPLDGATATFDTVRSNAKIPAEYGHDGWPWEDAIFPAAGPHNFHFTTEVVYWFVFDPTSAAALEFAGDDDVWVFVNGVLAVDLGGPHVPMFGSVTIDASAASRFALEPGKVYAIRVFHAERKVEGSSFKLTLSGFDASPSDCVPDCGDGIVTAGEECDDGINDGGYEECGEGCKLAESCGDGIVQPEEDCDDGNREDGDECGSSCRNLVVE